MQLRVYFVLPEVHSLGVKSVVAIHSSAVWISRLARRQDNGRMCDIRWEQYIEPLIAQLGQPLELHVCAILESVGVGC